MPPRLDGSRRTASGTADRSGSCRRRGTALVVACVLVWGGSALAAPPQPAAEPAKVLVMPLESDATQPRTYWLGEGVSILLSDGLLAAGVHALTRDQRVQVFDELHLPSSPSLSLATVIRVGQVVGAAEVVLGAVGLDEGSIAISVRTLAVREGRLRPEFVERGRIGDLFAICRRAATRVAAGIGAAAGPPGADAAGEVVPVDAFEAYVKGLLAASPEARSRLLAAAVEKYPGYDRALIGLWDVQTELGDHRAALQSARSVPTDSPRSARARFRATLSLIELRHYDEAFSALSALSGSGAHAAVFNNLGVVQLRRGPPSQTGLPVAYFNRAAELDPDDPDLFFNLGYGYLRDRDAQTAVYWLRQAVRRNPADGDAHYALAAALHASGAAREAERERALADGLSSKYDEWERRRQADDLVAAGLERLKTSLEPIHTVRFDRALMAAERDQREMTAFYVDRARRLVEAQKDGEALSDLRRALFLSPYDPGGLLLLARVHLRSGRAREAADAARVALWSEDSAAGRVVLGQALLELKDMSGARAEAQRALALDATSTDAKALLERIDAGGSR